LPGFVLIARSATTPDSVAWALARLFQLPSARFHANRIDISGALLLLLASTLNLITCPPASFPAQGPIGENR
jgi:hypothetical protein